MTPKKGDSVRADYVISGKVKSRVDIGEVSSVSKKDKTFTTEFDGEKTVRHFTFGVRNGIRLIGFFVPGEDVTETVEETPDESED